MSHNKGPVLVAPLKVPRGLQHFWRGTVHLNLQGVSNIVVCLSFAQDLCVKVVAGNFENDPSFGKLPDKYIKKVTDVLPLDLPLELVGMVSIRHVHAPCWHALHGTLHCARHAACSTHASMLLSPCSSSMMRSTGSGGATRGGRTQRCVGTLQHACSAQRTQLGQHKQRFCILGLAASYLRHLGQQGWCSSRHIPVLSSAVGATTLHEPGACPPAMHLAGDSTWQLIQADVL